MTPIDPYWSLIEFVTAVSLAVYFGRLGLNVLKVKVNEKIKKAKIEADSPKNFQGLSSLVENHDEILNQLFKLRKEQLDSMNKQGIPVDKQALALKPLDQRIKYVEIVKNNSFWLQFIAPHADRLIGVGLQALEKIMRGI